MTLQVDFTGDVDAVATALRGKPFVKSLEKSEKGLRITVGSQDDHRAEVSRAVSAAKGSLLGLTTDEMSLEEAFMTITEQNISLLAKGVEDHGQPK